MLRLSSRHAKPLDHRRRVSGRPQPRAGQKLPYLLRVPIEGGMVLKARGGLASAGAILLSTRLFPRDGRSGDVIRVAAFPLRFLPHDRGSGRRHLTKGWLTPPPRDEHQSQARTKRPKPLAAQIAATVRVISPGASCDPRVDRPGSSDGILLLPRPEAYEVHLEPTTAGGIYAHAVEGYW